MTKPPFPPPSLPLSLPPSGQFWNIPASVGPYTGNLIDGSPAVNLYVVNITSGNEPRGYAGWFHDLTWDFEEGPCVYVGNRQGGPIHEVESPSGSVIESNYKDYQVSGAFSEEGYPFGMFAEEMCIDALSTTDDSPGVGGADV